MTVVEQSPMLESRMVLWSLYISSDGRTGDGTPGVSSLTTGSSAAVPIFQYPAPALGVEEAELDFSSILLELYSSSFLLY